MKVKFSNQLNSEYHYITEYEKKQLKKLNCMCVLCQKTFYTKDNVILEKNKSLLNQRKVIYNFYHGDCYAKKKKQI